MKRKNTKRKQHLLIEMKAAFLEVENAKNMGTQLTSLQAFLNTIVVKRMRCLKSAKG